VLFAEYSIKEFLLKVDMAVARLQDDSVNSSIYVYVDSCSYHMLGPTVNSNEIHSSLAVLYTDALLRNLDKRFDDKLKQVAVAVRIFDPQVASTSVPKEESSEALELFVLPCTWMNIEQSAISE